MCFVQRCFVVTAESASFSIEAGEEYLAGTKEVIVFDEAEENSGENPTCCRLLQKLFAPFLEGRAYAIGGLSLCVFAFPRLKESGILDETRAHVRHESADDRLQGCGQ